MSYFIDPAARHRMSLEGFDGSENWVEVSAALTDAEEGQIAAALLKVEAVEINPDAGAGTTGNVAVVTRPDLQRFELLRRSLKAWSFEGDHGRVMPINETTIKRLGPVARWLAERIDAYYAGQKRTDETLGNSESGSSPTPPAAARSRAK